MAGDDSSRDGVPTDGQAVAAVRDVLLRFVRAHDALNRAGARQGASLTSQQAAATMFLLRHEGATVKSLADGLGISGAWASRLADELVVSGHVRRERDTADRRLVRLHTVPATRGMAERMYRERSQVVREAFSDAASEEIATLIRLLGRVVDGFEALAQQGETQRDRERKKHTS